MPTTRSFSRQVRINNDIIDQQSVEYVKSSGWLYRHWLTAVKYRNPSFQIHIFEQNQRIQEEWYSDCEAMLKTLEFDEPKLFLKFPELKRSNPRFMKKIHRQFKKEIEIEKLNLIYKFIQKNPCGAMAAILR